MTKRLADEAGAALILSLVILIALAGLSALYMQFAHLQHDVGARSVALVRARMTAEEAFHLSLAELRDKTDPDGDGLGIVTFTGADDREGRARVQSVGGNVFVIRTRGQMRSESYALEAVVRLRDQTIAAPDARAAVMVNGNTSLGGSPIIDGREHAPDGTLAGPGLLGVSSTGTVSWDLSLGGTFEVGGAGIAPANPPPAGTYEASAAWGDGADDDGDGLVDEETWDNTDDDSDGDIDEDTGTFPTTPDAYLGVPDGTLKSLATAHGTFFNDLSEFSSWVAAVGGSVPGGMIIYIAKGGSKLDLGPDFNTESSLVVLHDEFGDGYAKPLQGNFYGLLLLDGVGNMNGGEIRGALLVFSQSEKHHLGNGNSIVKYCSEALGTLPGGDPNAASRAQVISWNRMSYHDWDDSWGEVIL